MIEIEIDGKKIEAAEGAMIIQVADDAGIYIPRFCYHKKLSIAANCRMCLVEVEKAPKTLPACATPVAPGMKVFTQSEKAIFSQKAVMEFLLINHPLDCPICDQGGECELQDLSMGYGNGISRFNMGKRSVKDNDLGPLIASEMTRCIQCTRCVRFGTEVAGMPELGGVGRGEQLRISTYVEHAIKSEMSGNMIDVCPVGALTSKPYRFTARAWELRQHPAIAPHDCLGSNIFIHTRGEEFSPDRHVMRVVPRENESINEVWLSDRDRFSYEGINSADRVLKPLIKRDGHWVEVDWETALITAVNKLRAVQQGFGAEQIGALVSPNVTLEEGYLLQKLLRGIGSNNIDHRLHQSDFRQQAAMPAYPGLGFPIAELEKLPALLLIGSDVRQEQPIANARIRKAVVQNAAKVMLVNPIDFNCNFTVTEKLISGGVEFVITLGKILKALQVKTKQILSEEINYLLTSLEPTSAELVIAETLLTTENSAVILGAYAINHQQSAIVQTLAQAIATLSKAKFGYLTEGANSAGAWLAGVVPHRTTGNQAVSVLGLNAREMVENPLHAYVLMNVEPELDSAFAEAALQALQNADTVIAISSFRGGMMEEYADIILPMATFAETSGTYINAEGLWQFMQAATLPPGEARPAWKILRVLGNLFALAGFDYESSEQVCEEVKQLVAPWIGNTATPSAFLTPMQAEEYANLLAVREEQQSSQLQRFSVWPMYRTDSLVRRAESLQATLDEDIIVIRMNALMAARHHLASGDLAVATQDKSRLVLPVLIDEHIPDGLVFIPAGLDVTAGFGTALGEIKISRV